MPAILLLTLLASSGASTQPSDPMIADMTAAGLPPGTRFLGDDRGRFTKCLPPDGVQRTTEFMKSCTAFLRSRGKATGGRPLNAASWKISRPLAAAPSARGTTIVKLHISPAGAVEACSISTSSGHSVLDNAACDQLWAQARFIPATDKDGKPVPSTYTRSVIWR